MSLPFLQDVEYTIVNGSLHLLQVGGGQREAIAQLKSVMELLSQQLRTVPLRLLSMTVSMSLTCVR